MPSYLNLMLEKKVYQGFVVSITLVIALGVSAVFLGVAIRSRNLIHDEMISRARAHFDAIMMTRKWNATYGGVYVEKTISVVSNPYLKDPDIETTDGRVFTKKNPALMTREISKLFENRQAFGFHITSLKPINPENAPDDFERNALQGFEKGEREIFQIGSGKFRYMGRLTVEETCLQCHAEQGYKLNDIRGGISVSFEIRDVQRRLKNNFIVIMLSAISTVAILLTSIMMLISRLKKGLKIIHEEMERLALTDGLTGVFNRRHVMSRFQEEFERARRRSKDIGCILIDIDHFKPINDRFGHLAGDEVLKDLCRHVQSAIRGYDIFGRYGGEEFLLILPDTKLQDTRDMAERLRETVRQHLKVASGQEHPLPVTISLGVTAIVEGDQNIDEMLQRADRALYQAKENGRDRVECS